MNKNKRGTLIIALVLSLTFFSLMGVSALDYTRFYRFWNATENNHFYTSSKQERAEMSLEDPDLISEGVLGFIYTEEIPQTSPLYKLTRDKTEIYTISESERDALISQGFTYEGIEGHVYEEGGEGRAAIYKYFDSIIEDYLYVTSEDEKYKIDNEVGFENWEYEGIEGYLKEQTVEDDSQIIMRLYSPTNSHAAVWDYKVESPEGHSLEPASYNIYYDEIFSEPYLGENPHECTGNNKVLELYSESNSHAQVPGQNLNNYNINVCYGDLVCEARTDPEPCESDERVVVRLYQQTNSHVSNAETTSYPIKICCKTGSSVVTSEAYFTNLRGQEISEAQIGDTVMMVYKDMVGSNVQFEIKERDTLFHDDIRMITGFDSGEDYVALWTITREDYERGGNEDTQQDFYFLVDGTESEEIQVLKIVPENPNSPPTATITSPALSLLREQRRFKAGEPVTFTQNSWDEDDELIITWDFGDGTTYSCNWPQEPCDVYHTYETTGTKTVTLTAQEKGRNRRAKDYTEVYIYDEGTNLFPIIKTPPAKTPQNQILFPVNFNGSESYVSKCQTESCPVTTCYEFENLYCYDLLKTGTDIGTNPGQYNLWFNWTFSNGQTAYGDWSQYPDAVDFNRFFFKPQKYTAKLKIGYEEF